MNITDIQTQIQATRKLDIVAVIEVDEPLVQRGSDKWVGVNHDSLQVTPSKGLWHWWKRGVGGDAIQWMTEIHGQTFYDAIRDLIGFSGGRTFPQAPKAPLKPSAINPPYDMALVNRYHYDLLNNPNALAMIPKFGLSRSIVDEYLIGYKKDHWNMGESYVIPVLDGQKILTIRHRMWNPSDRLGKYLPERKGDGAQLFGWDKITKETVIVEGEKKAMVLNSVGIPTVGIMGADSFKKEFDARFAAVCKTAYIMLDPGNTPDELGVINHVAKIAWVKRLVEIGVDCRACWLPGKPDDMILEDNDFETVFASIQYSTRIKPLTIGK